MKKHILKALYRFLAFCSRIYIKKNNIYSIWITGSVGKTTCRTVISQILEKHSEQRIYTSPKNYNSELGLVFSIFKIEDYIPSIKNLLILCIKIFFTALFWKKNYDVIVLEYWIDRPLDMEFLLTINKPDISIFTKLDYTHSEFFTLWKQDVWEEKFKLMQAAWEKAYLNFWDEYCRSKMDELDVEGSYFWKEWDCENYELTSKDNKVSAQFKTHWKTITTNAIGEANMYYIELWFSILDDVKETVGSPFMGDPDKGHPQGVSLQEENTIYLELSGQKARFNVLEWINRSVLVDSTYNAAPASMKKIINDTKIIREQLYPDYKLWFCLWDMREVWSTSGELHKEIYEIVKDSDLVVVSNPEMNNNFWENAQKFETSREAWKYLKDFLESTSDKYLILFKWSQNTVFIEEALIQVLKNTEDAKQLCRQEDFWKKQKDKYFNSLSK